MTTNFFTQTGSSLESCASYQGVNGISCGSSCAILENVDGWRYLASDTTTIKTALYEHGPIYTSMYASDPAFHVYTGGVYEYSGPEEPNHAVLIIGWDDALGPDGAWMVKNSWGTGWGMDGYFYIAYGDARIGEDSNYIASHKHCDAHETLLYYDEGGITSSIGDGSAVCYGAVVFTPGASGRLTAVDFWTVDDDISYEISIYDAMTGNTMGNLLASQSGNSAELGYYSVALNDPVPLAAGDDFVVSVRFTTTGYGYPVPLDDNSPLELGKCFLSLDGSSWMRIDEEGFFYDVAIRARVSADSDADGIIDASDNCPDDSNANQLDSDADGIGDVCDNCPMHSNGPAYGTCVRSLSEVVIGSEVPCTDGGQCEAGKTCQMEQGDCNGNGIGDVCECYADCDCSTNVNLSDLVMMKAQYLRDDCATNLCQADCNGDKQVNLSDLVIVKAQYFRNDCPSCL
jgi:hypothetical protein